MTVTVTAVTVKTAMLRVNNCDWGRAVSRSGSNVSSILVLVYEARHFNYEAHIIYFLFP